jgi:KaiC domain protein
MSDSDDGEDGDWFEQAVEDPGPPPEAADEPVEIPEQEPPGDQPTSVELQEDRPETDTAKPSGESSAPDLPDEGDGVPSEADDASFGGLVTSPEEEPDSAVDDEPSETAAEEVESESGEPAVDDEPSETAADEVEVAAEPSDSTTEPDESVAEPESESDTAPDDGADDADEDGDGSLFEDNFAAELSGADVPDGADGGAGSDGGGGGDGGDFGMGGGGDGGDFGMGGGGDGGDFGMGGGDGGDFGMGGGDGGDFGMGGGGGGDFGMGGGGGGDFGMGGGGDSESFDDEELDSDIDRIELGIEGLDAMIQGGVPERTLMVAIGSAGTGKTTFGLQFLQKGLSQGERGVYITLEETRHRVIRSATEKGLPFDEYHDDGDLAVVDIDPVEMANSLQSIRSELPRLIEEFGASRLVLDSVSLLEMMYEEQAVRRNEIYDFTKALKDAGVTTMMTSEASSDTAYASRHGLVEYLTDAVFILQYVRPSDFRETRLAIEIQKIRDAHHSRETKPYEITDDGLSVYRRANIF